MKKISYLIVVIVAAVVLGIIYFYPTPASKLAKNEAPFIIEAALQATKYVTDLQMQQDLRMALSNMKVCVTDADGHVEAPDGQFFLVITKGELLYNPNPSNKNGRTLFQFDHRMMETGHRVVILMNEETPRISKNIDGKGVLLIHELIHALQANKRTKQGIKTADVPALPDEIEAWDVQVALYHKMHPEIFEGVTCDCATDNLNINPAQKSILEGDDLAQNMLFYYFCKERFMKKVYNMQ